MAALTSGADQVRRMRNVAQAFRRQHPLSAPTWTAGSYPLAGSYAGQPAVKTLVWFPSVGCQWSLSGGCTMCDFGMNTDALSVEEATAAFVAHLATLDQGLRRIHVAPGGSFFSAAEVSGEMRASVLATLQRFPFLRSVGMESRPNLLHVDELLETVRNLPRGVVDLTIGFGFECRTDLVRDIAINKGFGPEAVVRAAEVIAEVNRLQSDVHVAFEVYVLLKPILLTEGEGIDEAIRTLEWSYAVGAETAALFMNTVKPQTIQGHLAGRRDLGWPLAYEPPCYRSAIEVLRRLAPRERARTVALGVQSGILADGLPRGCELCSPFLLGALMAHNFTRDSATLDQAATATCPCHGAWLAELQRPVPALDERVERTITHLEAEFGQWSPATSCASWA